MKMKKVIILGGIAVALCATLAGCGTEENEVKSISKEVGEVSVNLNENNGDTTKVEGNTEENVADKKDEKGKVESNVTSEKKRAVYTKYTEVFTDDGGRSVIVYGYDESGNRVWEYEAPMETSMTEFYSVDFLENDYPRQSALLKEFGVIKALDIGTGEEKWSYKENIDSFTYGAIVFKISEEGTIVIYDMEGQKFVLIDKDGKKIKEYDIANYGEELPNFNGPHDLALIDEKTITMDYYLTIDEEVGNKVRSTVYEKSVTIDTSTDKVSFETINTEVYEYEG